jgi:hypothetical protein
VANRELRVSIVSDARQFSKGFDQAGREVNKFGKQVDKAGQTGFKGMSGRIDAVSASFRTLGTIAAGGIVGTKILGFAKDSIDAFSDLNESVNAVNVVFGEAADGILEIGRNSAESLGVAKSDFNQLAVGFGAFAEKIAGASGDDVVNVIDTLTTRIADFASVMNLDFNEAAEKFRSGLAGETEPLRQFNIDVSAAAVTQKALQLGLADTASELRESDKVYARYQLIMEQTQKTQGDFANTSDELAGKQRKLAAKFKDVQAEVGEKLAGPLTSILGLLEDLLPVVGDLAEVFGDLSEPLAQIVGVLGELGGTADDAAESTFGLVDIFKIFTKGIQDVSGVTLFMDLWEGWNNLWAGGGNTKDAVDVMAEFGGTISAAHPHGRALVDDLNEIDETAEHLAHLKGPDTLRRQLRDAADAARATRLAILELANPAFAATKARERQADAEKNLEDLKKSGKASAKELAAAELEVAEARIETFSALERFDGSGTAGSVKLIADALGISFAEAQNLLSTLDVLEGKSLTIPIVFQFSQVGNIPTFGPDVINGRPIPNSSTTNNNTSITVNNPTPSAAPADIQRELLLSGITRSAETITRS